MTRVVERADLRQRGARPARGRLSKHRPRPRGQTRSAQLSLPRGPASGLSLGGPSFAAGRLPLLLWPVPVHPSVLSRQEGDQRTREHMRPEVSFPRRGPPGDRGLLCAVQRSADSVFADSPAPSNSRVTPNKETLAEVSTFLCFFLVILLLRGAPGAGRVPKRGALSVPRRAHRARVGALLAEGSMLTNPLHRVRPLYTETQKKPGCVFKSR